jgi:hypothetical protein
MWYLSELGLEPGLYEREVKFALTLVTPDGSTPLAGAEHGDHGKVPF